MYRQKLNPRLLFHFQSKVNQQVGLMTILTPSTPSTTFTNSSELQRFTRLEEAKLRERLTSSAIKIQKNFRMFSAMNQLKFLKKEKEFKIKTKSSIKIQSYIRGFLDRKKFKFLKICKKISETREIAARIIQKRLRFNFLKKRIKVLTVSAKILRTRQLAALQIQKRLRGFFVRKDLFYVKSGKISMLVAWRYPAKSVFICGSFTYPPWRVEIPLVYSKYFDGFCSGFFIENKLKVGDYLLKFIVDGCWLCDGKYPITQDSEGNYNNLIKVSKPRSKSHRSASQPRVLKSYSKVVDFYLQLPFLHDQNYLNSFLSTSNSNSSVTLKSSSWPTSSQTYTSELNSHQVIILFQASSPSSPLSPSLSSSLSSPSPRTILTHIIQKAESSLSKLHKQAQTTTHILKDLKSVLVSNSNLSFFSLTLSFLHHNTLNILNSGKSSLIIFRKRHKTRQLSKIFQSSPRPQSTFSSPESWIYYSKSLEGPNWVLPSQSSSNLNLNLNSTNLPSEQILTNQIDLQADDILIFASEAICTFLPEDYIKDTCEKLSNSIYTPEHYCEKIAKTLVDESKLRKQNGSIFLLQNQAFEHQAIVAVACGQG